MRINRRELAQRLGMAAASAGLLSETVFAQRAITGLAGDLPADMVWLNANENPAGPPASAIAAMTKALPTAGRYRYPEFREFYSELARSEELSADQILVGAGSSEVLHAAVDAFTTPMRPIISMSPTYELPGEVARGHGRRVINSPLTDGYFADVRKMAGEADKAGGGLIYICNPNNPTSAITPKQDIEWLANNLPANTFALIDEAYLHFAEPAQMESALKYVREGKNVIVTRTFSKIYGMAGLRAGFACARPDLISRMAPFRNNVISIVTVQGVLAAVAESKTLLPQRRATLARTRRELCTWLKDRGLNYIDPQANFIMIDVGRDVRPLAQAMARGGVAVGRPFPPLDKMLRVSIGTDQDMAKFRDVFARTLRA